MDVIVVSLKKAAIIATVCALAACASVTNRVGRAATDLYQIPQVAKRKIAQAGPEQTARGTSTPIDLDSFKFLNTDTDPAYYAAVTDSDKNGSSRDRLRAVLVARSDLICAEVQAQIVGTNDLVNFGLSELTTVLAGAGAIVTGATSAKILSGTAAVFNATRSNVNEVFYQNAFKTAIIQKMNELRTAQLAVVYAREKSGAVAKYSTEDMIMEVQRYHNLCSFYAGVTGLTQANSVFTPKDVKAFIDEVKRDIEALRRTAPSPSGDAAPTVATPANPKTDDGAELTH